MAEHIQALGSIPRTSKQLLKKKKWVYRETESKYSTMLPVIEFKWKLYRSSFYYFLKFFVHLKKKLCMVLGIEPQDACLPGKHSTTELRSSALISHDKKSQKIFGKNIHLSITWVSIFSLKLSKTEYSNQEILLTSSRIFGTAKCLATQTAISMRK